MARKLATGATVRMTAKEETEAAPQYGIEMEFDSAENFPCFLFFNNPLHVSGPHKKITPISK